MTTKGENKDMISTTDLYKEIKKVESALDSGVNDPIDIARMQLKVSCLQTKLLHNIRTNMVQVMDAFKVPKVQPKTQRDEKDE